MTGNEANLLKRGAAADVAWPKKRERNTKEGREQQQQQKPKQNQRQTKAGQGKGSRDRKADKGTDKQAGREA